MFDRLRWLLATWLAGGEIMHKPGKGDGVYIVIRDGPFTSTMAADKFRLRTMTRPRSFAGLGPDDWRPRGGGTTSRFVGTITAK